MEEISITRKKFTSEKARNLLKIFCRDTEIHSTLQVTYGDIANRVFSWLYTQPIETYNSVIEILESEILASEDKCFTGRISRLVSVLDGFHPGVRITIATSDQISNRILMKINDCKKRNLSIDDTKVEIEKELDALEIDDSQKKEWLQSVNDLFEDI
jgi:hypothetical protein